MTYVPREHAPPSIGEGTVWRRGMARQYKLCFAIVASLALCTVARPSQGSELGVNYNGVTRTYRRADVAETAATWVRAFVDVRKLQQAGADTIASDPDLAAIARACTTTVTE